MKSIFLVFILSFSLLAFAAKKSDSGPKDYDSPAADDVIYGPDGPQDDGIRWPDGEPYDIGGAFLEECESELGNPELF